MPPVTAATFIPLERDPALSIPFRVHSAAGRMAVLNTFGMPYRQQLLVVDTDTQEILGRWRFETPGGAGRGRRLFHLDAQLTPDGRRVVLVGGELLDASGDAFAPECVLTCIEVDGSGERRMNVGPLGFNYVSACPDGATALVIYNGNNGDQVQFHDLRVVDLKTMTVTLTRTLDAPVNNVLYRPAEGRALVSVGREVRSLSLDGFELGERACPRFNHPYLLAQFAPDDRLIYAAYVASRMVVKAVDVAARSVAAEYTFSWPWNASTNVVTFGAEHLLFPPSSSAGAICLWNRHEGLITHKITLPGAQILSTPHPDGQRLYLYDYAEQRLMLVDAAPLLVPVPREQGRGW